MRLIAGRHPGRRAARHREQGGAVIILTAVLLPVLILVAGISIDIGNWFEHRRHLQTQATAGALAGGLAFRFPCSDAINTQIRQAARDYSGDGSDVANATNFNDQVGGTPASRVHRRLNSRLYARDDTQNRPSPVDTDVDPSLTPCAARMLDVKLTETDLPWFLAPLKFVRFINAHARVEVKKQASGKGLLPIGVPDPNPTQAYAYFMDETAATPVFIAGTKLVKGPTVSNITTWDNVAVPKNVPIKVKNIGVRIALSGGPLDPATGNPVNPLTGDPAVDCIRPLVQCYDAGSTKGLVHIRGYSTAVAGTSALPQARGVELVAGTCGDPYFTSSAPCTVGVQATVQFGVADPASISATLVTRVGNKNYNLTYDPLTGTWKSPTTIPVPAGGSVDIVLDWQTGTGQTQKSGTFGLVQRAFGASDDRSGPIRSMNVTTASPIGPGNSFPRCDAGCPKNLVVTLGVKSAFIDAQQSATATPVELRLTGTGSLTQALDCDPDVPNLKDELAVGCAPTYRPNNNEACPKPSVLYGASPLYPDPPGLPCVAVATGADPNQIAEGMNLRILGDNQPKTCASSQYNNWRTAFPLIPKDDPRIIQVFLTPFGAFSGNGSGTVPVSRLAAFYVTGWRGQGNGFENPCQDDPSIPVNRRDDIPATKGSIVGHFMNYVTPVNDGGATDDLCDPTEAGLCVAVLTR